VGFGALGTAVYAGLTVGSAAGTKLYASTKGVKHILAGSLALNAVALVAFTISRDLTVNLFVRFCTGVVQVFICIFTPVWADAFGSEQLKNAWITGLLLSSPAGIFTGFVLTSVLNSADGPGWEYSFYIQATLVIPCVICLYRTDMKYLDVQLANKFRRKCLEQV
jgi:predicted MFS family arabinose efflux permease